MTILGHTGYGIPAPTFTTVYNRTLTNSIFSLVHIYIASENAQQR